MEFTNLFDSKLTNYLFLSNFAIFFSVIYFLIKKKLRHPFFLKVSDHNYHKNKVFNNAGLILIVLFLFSNILIYYYVEEFFQLFTNYSSRYYLFLIGVFLLLVMSTIDEFKQINPTIRLMLQITICYLSLPIFKFPIFEFLPQKLEFLIIVYFLVLIINSNNFIDGSDGVMSICSIIIYLGVIIFSYFENQIYPATLISIIMISLILPFLFFNWPKAKIFIGDTGSIPIGFINGYLIIFFAQIDYVFFGIILFLYPLVDVNLTLIRKTLNGIPPWARLFDYFFLAPTLIGGMSHFYVLKRIIIVSLVNLISAFFYYFYSNYNFFLIALIPNIYLIYLFNKFRK
jgi:Fuc2NAc and GlcNAc transferase